MSSQREPMWYCHQCHAEMRPLMVPDPACASCHSSFVEKMDDPSNDPRDFVAPGAVDDDDAPPGVDIFLRGLQALMGGPNAPPPRPRSPSTPRMMGSNSGGFTVAYSSSGGGPRTFRIGGGPRSPVAERSGSPPTLSEFNRRGPENEIGGNLMAQYLLTLLAGPGRTGGGGPPGPFSDFLSAMNNPAEHGRMGDYVFNQEALDQIITQLMENSNSHRPVPAPEDVIEKLPREVLEEDSSTLQKDCAVCKEQFKIDTEDPAEQVVITLPCQHPFHEPCITPWLKSSGTCPVCRHALVPQPSQTPGSPGPGPGLNQDGPSNRNGGFLSSLFGGNGGGDANSSSTPQTPSSRPSQSDNSQPHVPGEWRDAD